MMRNYPNRIAYNLKAINLNLFSFNSIVKGNLMQKLVFSCFLTIMLFADTAFAQSPSIFTTSGTWKCPAGVTSINIEAYGAGGGSGRGGSNNKEGGGGGGGGAYVSASSVAVTPGVTYTITIGAGGAAGISTSNGLAGGATTASFDAATITANGGGGGLNFANGATGGAGGAGGTRNGGSGATGTTLGSGGGGGCGGPTSNGTNGTVATAGTGGGGVAGNGGAGQLGNAGSGVVGSNYGGGAGGSTKSTNGLTGAGGYMSITFTCPSITPNAGTDQNLTACTTSATLAASAAPANTTGTWTQISGAAATITSPNSPTSTVTGLALNASATFRWTIDNGRCGTSSDDVVITTVTGPGCLTYCTAGGSAAATSYITNVTLNTINQNNATWGGYRDYYPTVSTNLMQAVSYSISVTIWNNTISQKNISAWVDWNSDGIYNVGTETILSTTSTVASAQSVTLTNTFTVPGGAVVNLTRLRVELAFNTEGAAAPCNVNSLTDVQDYKINVLTGAACTTPTAQPTALNLTPTGTTIAGSFTAASPAADSYLVVVSTSATPPTPINGTTYTIGGTVGAGYTVVDIDNNTTFNATGLSALTTYYLYVFSYNSVCSGGPLYYTTAPLINSTTTLAANYCTPSVSAGAEDLTYFTNISFVGTLNDTSNNSTYSTSPRGYQDFSGLATLASQAQGEGVNISTQTTNRGYLKAWVDWNKDGDFADVGEDVYSSGGVATYSTTFGFVIPAAQAVGNYRVRIRINKDGDGNYTFNSCGNIVWYGETEDYLFTVVASCSARITSVTNGVTCGSGPVNLSVTGTAGVTQYRWYTALTGGAPVATTATGSWTTPSLSSTTTYYVTAFNGCESLVRTAITATVSPIPTLSFTPSNPEVCGEQTVISLTATGDTEQVYLIDENFEGGMGVFTNANYIANGATVNANAAWQGRTSTYVPTNPPGQVWFPAISSGFGTNKFVSTTSDLGSYNIHTGLISPTVNTTSFVDLTLSFDIFYSRYYIDGANLTLDYVTVDISTNGGGAWTELTRYTADQGIGTRFANKTFTLPGTYLNQTNLKVRVRYYGEWCDGVAVDNVKLFGTKPLNTAFNWSGASLPDAYSDAACTIPYVAGTPAVTVYVKPTLAQLEQGSYTFTASAILSNGCSASTPITVTNNSKVWKGTSSTDWNNPNNWLPLGVPTSSNCVVIPANSIITGSGYNAYAKNVTIKNTGNLELQSSNNLTVTEWVNNQGGVFNIRNTASLVQINNVANTGNVMMERTANMRKLDYVYWSSPVAGFASSAISAGTPTGFIYKWTPTIAGNTNGFGNWAVGSESMTLGKGYIVRGPDSFTSALQNYTANFTGVPNNGTIPVSISRGTYNGVDYNTGVSTTLGTKDDDNWNLLGNPYPSAVNAIAFLTANTNIAGFINVWTHGTLPASAIADPFYNNFVYNYTAGDYITYNSAGASSGPGVFNGNIGAGQGFFVSMNHTSALATENVNFTNAMRSNTYSNSQFFRSAEDTGAALEDGKIWLDIIAPNNNAIRTLVSYVDGATNEKDRLFDAATDGKMNFTIYSLINDEKFIIQGKALPFDMSDSVPLGIKIPQDGIYKIGIGAVEGIFSDSNQTIYLHDLDNNVIHNLREMPYTFTATTGKYDNRFVLKYVNSTLGNSDVTALENSVVVYKNDKLNVKSAIEPIKEIVVYDLLGRILTNNTKVNANEFTVSNLNPTETTLIVKVTLENNTVVTKKVIY
jgi:GEVED domain-containing protein/Ig-like domain-containing protein